jgi:pSer/pThr/pTyr-binding forkhead associated (FHA) protein
VRGRLFSRHGKLGPLDFEIGEEATIGRSQSSSIVLPARAISSRHASIRLDRERDRYVLEDLGSLNGTELDGVRLEGPESLGPLHVVTVAGRFDFIFQDRGAVSASVLELGARETDAEPAVEPRPQGAAVDGDTMVEQAPVELPSAIDDGGRPTTDTIVESGPVALPASLDDGAGAKSTTGEKEREKPPPKRRAPTVQASVVLELPGALGVRALPRVPGENVVGRTSDADVTIFRPAVSRRHAVLRVEGGRVFVRDLDSANRTYVGDVPLDPGHEVELVPGARLRFGDVEACIRFSKAGEGNRSGSGGTEVDDD